MTARHAKYGDPLTPMEKAVLRALADGAPQKEVADDLGISYQNVKNHLTCAYTKLDARGLVEAYHRIGAIRLPDWLVNG